MWWWIGALIVTAWLSFAVGLVLGAAVALDRMRDFGVDVDRMM